MLSHAEQDKIVIRILEQIAAERNKSPERIKRLLLIKQNRAIDRRFWEILNKLLPGHSYRFLGCCTECGAFKLR